jgi:hypothetical protein
LILQANPNLTWRDVQGVIISSSKKIDVRDSDWKVNGGGYHVNHKYGFGLIDAANATQVAKTWKLLPVVKEITKKMQNNDQLNSLATEVNNLYSSFPNHFFNVLFFYVRHLRQMWQMR